MTRAPEESKAGGHPDTPDKSGETARRGILMLATGVARFALAEHFHAATSTFGQSHRPTPPWLISRQRAMVATAPARFCLFLPFGHGHILSLAELTI